MTVVKVKKTVAKTKRSARMSDYAPILMPRWLHTVDPVARGAISRRIAEEFTLLMQREGVRAFEMPRSAACAHESGHAIVETVLGARVKSVQIHTCLQLRGAWQRGVGRRDTLPWRYRMGHHRAHANSRSAAPHLSHDCGHRR